MGKQDFSESALKAAWEGQEATRVVWPREVEGASVKGPRGSGQALTTTERKPQGRSWRKQGQLGQWGVT